MRGRRGERCSTRISPISTVSRGCSLLPGLAIAVTVLGFTLIADGSVKDSIHDVDDDRLDGMIRALSQRGTGHEQFRLASRQANLVVAAVAI